MLLLLTALNNYFHT